MRREDILHAVPLVCVMVPKGCVLVLLTVMIVGVELNSRCQAALVMYWAIHDRDTTHSSSYTVLSPVNPAVAGCHCFGLLMECALSMSNDDTW